MANNKKALEKLFKISKKHQEKRISTNDYLNESAKIIFNDLSSSARSNFRDDIEIITTVRDATKGDVDAAHRLLCDFYLVNVSLTIKKVN